MSVSVAGSQIESNNKVAWLWLGLFGLFALRLIYLIVSELPMFYDEAYYHYWATHLDWGYYSKPPMVAWAIAATSAIFGHQPEWTVKLGAPLFYFATTFVVYDLAKRLFDQQTATYAALIFFSMPLISFNSLFITTDAPLMFFWALTLWLFVTAKESSCNGKQTFGWWIAAGVAGGLGLLSKYTMGVVAIAIFLFVLTSKAQRKLLFQPGIWITATVAAVVFLPNLIWNYQHDFISFQHTSEISKLNESLINPDKFLEFFAGQLLVFGPVAFCLLLMLFKQRRTSDTEKLLFYACIAMLGVISIQAFLARAHVNWAAPSYVTASILVANWLAKNNRQKLLQWLVAVNLLLAAAFYFYQPIQQSLGFEPSRKNNPFHRVTGWREVTLQVPNLVADYQDRIWLSDSRKVLSYLHFYLSDFENGNELQLASFNLDGHINHHFDLAVDLAVSESQQFIFISDKAAELDACFEQVRNIGELEEVVYPSLSRQLYVYHVSGFKGYEYCR